MNPEHPPQATLQAVLAMLYTDTAARERFLNAPERAVQDYALSPEDRAALLALDRAGLILAARSFAKKRAHAESRKAPLATAKGRWERLRDWWRGR